MKKCSNCYFHDVCEDNLVCEDYAPLGDEAEWNETEELIKQEKNKFLEEWNQYINEYEIFFKRLI